MKNGKRRRRVNGRLVPLIRRAGSKGRKLRAWILAGRWY